MGVPSPKLEEEMMMRRHAWLAVAAALALAAGCDDEPAETDGGVDAAAPGEDAGGGGMDGAVDAGGGNEDAGGGEEDGGTADSGTMADAGPPLMVDGCAEATITIQDDCPDFTACGGTLDDPNYCYTGICIEEAEILGPLGRYCTDASIESAVGAIAGRVSFLSATEVHRESVSHIEATLAVPSNCVVVLLAGGCGPELAMRIQDEVPGSSASCAPAGDQCRCDVTLDLSVNMTESFTADPSTGALIIGTDTSARTFEYCVDETSGVLQFRETTDDEDAIIEPGIQSLAPSAS